MKIIRILLALFFIATPCFAADYIIADHSAVDEFDQIPEEWITAAKALAIHYGHTSHGMQILKGLDYIRDEYGALYSYNDSTYYCDYNTVAGCNSTAESYSPIANTLTFLDVYRTYTDGAAGYWDGTDAMNRTRYYASLGSFDLSMFGWCDDLAVDYEEDQPAATNRYLSAMDTFESEYPAMRFIYETGVISAASDPGYVYDNNQKTIARTANEAIRAHVIANGKVLFDRADIESYPESGEGPCVTNDQNGESYNDYPVECDWETTSCSCTHSECGNCIRQAKAFWWLMARIAGWPGVDGETPATPATISYGTLQRGIRTGGN